MTDTWAYIVFLPSEQAAAVAFVLGHVSLCMHSRMSVDMQPRRLKHLSVLFDSACPGVRQRLLGPCAPQVSLWYTFAAKSAAGHHTQHIPTDSPNKFATLLKSNTNH